MANKQVAKINYGGVTYKVVLNFDRYDFTVYRELYVYDRNHVHIVRSRHKMGSYNDIIDALKSVQDDICNR